MPLPLILGGLGRMGLGIGTAALGGLGMGFGYGYGVRAGYNAYKPSKNNKTNQMVLSPNPVTAGTGMGLHTAEQLTDKKTGQLPIQGVTDSPQGTPTFSNAEKLKMHGMVQSNDGSRTIERSKLKTHEDYRMFMKYNIAPNETRRTRRTRRFKA